MNQSQAWGHKPNIPLSLIPIPDTRPRSTGYEIKSVNRVLVIGLARARRAMWRRQPGLTRARSIPREPLPSENIAAIKLLDSWLSTPDVERDEFQERLDRLVEENRL